MINIMKDIHKHYIYVSDNNIYLPTLKIYTQSLIFNNPCYSILVILIFGNNIV